MQENKDFANPDCHTFQAACFFMLFLKKVLHQIPSLTIIMILIYYQERKMALDTSYVGKEFGPFYFTVERGKIKEFCLAIGDDNPLFFDPGYAKEKGYKDTPAPLTFPIVMNFWAFPELYTKMVESVLF